MSSWYITVIIFLKAFPSFITTYGKFKEAQHRAMEEMRNIYEILCHASHRVKQIEEMDTVRKKIVEWQSGSDEMLEWDVLDGIEWIKRILWLVFGLS